MEKASVKLTVPTIAGEPATADIPMKDWGSWSKTIFTHLEHKLPNQIGLALTEIILRRSRDFKNGQDWIRQGRWIKWSEEGVQKLKGQIGVPDILPPAPDPTRKSVEVLRMNFPNQRIIEVMEFDSGRTFHVRIKPEWRHMYRPKMKIEAWLREGESVATTRRPKGVFRY